MKIYFSDLFCCTFQYFILWKLEKDIEEGHFKGCCSIEKASLEHQYHVALQDMSGSTST